MQTNGTSANDVRSQKVSKTSERRINTVYQQPMGNSHTRTTDSNNDTTASSSSIVATNPQTYIIGMLVFNLGKNFLGDIGADGIIVLARVVRRVDVDAPGLQVEKRDSNSPRSSLSCPQTQTNSNNITRRASPPTGNQP